MLIVEHYMDILAHKLLRRIDTDAVSGSDVPAHVISLAGWLKHETLSSSSSPPPSTCVCQSDCAYDCVPLTSGQECSWVIVSRDMFNAKLVTTVQHEQA